VDTAVAGRTMIAVLLYSTFFHNYKGKLARRKALQAIGRREDLEHALAHEKWPFVNGHFLFK
jgi:hypothetical protein